VKIRFGIYIYIDEKKNEEKKKVAYKTCSIFMPCSQSTLTEIEISSFFVVTTRDLALIDGCISLYEKIKLIFLIIFG
jgi:hypothetical protein